MSKTITDSQQTDMLNDSPSIDSLRPFIQQLSLKTIQLGQLVLDLYAQGQLTHTAIVPLCDELLALEITWPTDSSASDKLVETATAVPVTDPNMSPLPPATAVASTPENPPAPTHCPQCHAELAPGKKFCTTCGLPLASMGAPDSAGATIGETSATLTNPPALPTINSLCPTCGTALQPNAAFCTHCGHPLGGQTLTPAGVPIATTSPGLQTMADTMPPPLPQAQPTGPVTQFCLNCGKGLPADITVCPDCSGTEFDPI